MLTTTDRVNGKQAVLTFVVCAFVTFVSASSKCVRAQDSTIRYGQGVPSAVRLINKRGL